MSEEGFPLRCEVKGKDAQVRAVKGFVTHLAVIQNDQLVYVRKSCSTETLYEKCTFNSSHNMQ